MRAQNHEEANAQEKVRSINQSWRTMETIFYRPIKKSIKIEVSRPAKCQREKENENYTVRGNSAARSIVGKKGASISNVGNPIYSTKKGPKQMLKSSNSQARIEIKKENKSMQHDRMEWVQRARAKERAKMKAKMILRKRVRQEIEMKKARNQAVKERDKKDERKCEQVTKLFHMGNINGIPARALHLDDADAKLKEIYDAGNQLDIDIAGTG